MLNAEVVKTEVLSWIAWRAILVTLLLLSKTLYYHEFS